MSVLQSTEQGRAVTVVVGVGISDLPALPFLPKFASSTKEGSISGESTGGGARVVGLESRGIVINFSNKLDVTWNLKNPIAFSSRTAPYQDHPRHS